MPDLVDSAFALLARLRGAKAFHPRGGLFRARVLVTEPDSAIGRVLPREQVAVVRASKGAGTPPWAPDLLGLALRVAPADGGPLDLLFSTVSPFPFTRSVLAPSTGWCRLPYSVLLPYGTDVGWTVLGLEPEDAGQATAPSVDRLRAAVRRAPVAFALTESPVAGPRRTVGRLVLEAALPPDAPEIAFDPVLHDHPRLRPAPLVSGLRRRAYAGSRQGWDAAPADLERAVTGTGAPQRARA